MRGAWIEIAESAAEPGQWKSLPVRGAWIEMAAIQEFADKFPSLPVRGAWIEMTTSGVNTDAQICRSL